MRVLKPQGILYVNNFLLNVDEQNLSRYEKFKEIYGVYGVFELPEDAVCRHHDEKWSRQLLRDFSQLDYSHVTCTTMNGHISNGFYFSSVFTKRPSPIAEDFGQNQVI